MPSGCAESAIVDLPARWQLPEYPSSWQASSTFDKKWGPHLSLAQKFKPLPACQCRAGKMPSGCHHLLAIGCLWVTHSCMLCLPWCLACADQLPAELLGSGLMCVLSGSTATDVGISLVQCLTHQAVPSGHHGLRRCEIPFPGLRLSLV